MTADVCVFFSNQWILMVLIGKTFCGGGWFIKHRNLFLTHLKPGKSKINVLADLVSTEGLLCGS